MAEALNDADVTKLCLYVCTAACALLCCAELCSHALPC